MKPTSHSSREKAPGSEQELLPNLTANATAPSHAVTSGASGQDPLQQLAELSKKLAKSEGLPLKTRENLIEKCLAAARSLDLPKAISNWEVELEKIRRRTSGELQQKRQIVLQFAQKAGFPVREYSNYDRIGPVRVTHKELATNVLFGKLRLHSFEESNGERAAEVIISQIKGILESGFNPAAYYSAFRRAYEHARVEVPSRDGWLRVDSIYAEFSLGRIRGDLNKGEIPKNASPYPIVMFLVDFARFFQKPLYPSEHEYIRSRTPTMGQTQEVYLVPDLSVPMGDERPILDLRIERET